MSKIWYVEFPTFQYNEDVKALAKERGLTIIDAKFDDGDGVKDPPELTLKGATQEVDYDELISRLDTLKAGELKSLAAHLGVEYTNADGTKAAIKEKLGQ
nr:MAG TPA: Siz1 ligase, DNA binding, sumoylation [Caudoviricetes sp.]